MYKALLKKQLSEIFRSYLYNAKTNKPRKKGDIIRNFVLFGLLMVAVLGGMFLGLAFILCPILVSVNMTWLYYAMFSIIALALGVFGSVFNTYSGLYLSKDNDLLLSMPIPVNTLMLSKLASVYFMGLMYSGVVILPAEIVYLIVAGFSFSGLLGGICLLLFISFIVLILSCALGWVIARISLKLKNKSLTTVLMSLAFIAIYYFVILRAQNLINDIILNYKEYATSIKQKAYPIYLLGTVGEGKITSVLIFLAAVGLLLFVTWYILSKSFLKIAISSKNVAKVKYKEKESKVSTSFGAILKKEFARFKSSPNYMLNCGLGTILIPVTGILLLIKGQDLKTMLESLMPGSPGMSVSVLIAGICLIATMNDSATPSISLEGKGIWQIQALPISMKSVLLAKLAVQFILTAFPIFICSICAIIALKLSVVESLALITLSLSFVCLADCFDLMIGIKYPLMNWTNEIVPIKQSLGVPFAIICGWGYAILFEGFFFLFRYLGAGPEIFYAAMFVLTAVLTLIIYKWIMKKGVKIVEEL